MPLDPVLDLFAKRLLISDEAPLFIYSTEPEAVEQRNLERTKSLQFYKEALKRVCYKFNAELPLPFEDRVQKAYPSQGFVQLHFPARDLIEMSELGMNWYPEEWVGLYPMETKLGEWLLEHASEIADQFIKGAREKNLDTLYRLELPEGAQGVLFQVPFRLIWDYRIAEDCYVARFDLIGHVSESQ